LNIQQIRSLSQARWSATWASSIALIVLVLSFVYWMPKSIDGFRGMASRTESEEYKTQYAAYLLVEKNLSELAKARQEKLTVSFDPALFPLKSGAKYEIVHFWGPFTEWTSKPDVIVFSQRHTLKGASVAEDSPAYAAFLEERAGYDKYVVENGTECTYSQCYERISTLPNGGEILVLMKSTASS
jgi:hypothetical protein